MAQERGLRVLSVEDIHLFGISERLAAERHCLVQHLLSWRFAIESLMRSVMVVVMYKLLNPLACARPTADPRVMEAVDSHFEGVEPLFDMIPVSIVELTAQS